MIGLGAAEIIILGFFCIFFFVGLILGIVALVSLSRQRGGEGKPKPGTFVREAPSQVRAEDRDSQLDVIARVTRRFCPQCRAPLATDAPEGLCPACLLAEGIESAVAAPIVDGAAVTTPPSASKPPLAGEIGDLQPFFPQLEILELLGPWWDGGRLQSAPKAARSLCRAESHPA